MPRSARSGVRAGAVAAGCTEFFFSRLRQKMPGGQMRAPDCIVHPRCFTVHAMTLA